MHVNDFCISVNMFMDELIPEWVYGNIFLSRVVGKNLENLGAIENKN